jgi:polyphosphate glucokinase
MRCVGIDVGGTGIKAGEVDTELGELVTPRIRVLTPHPASPDAVAAAAAALIEPLGHDLPVGIGFPAAVRDGTTLTAANVDPAWIGLAAQALFSVALGRPAVVLNDADAAGLAEVRFGAGRGVTGVVVLLTLGTGIGSALFVDGRLVPNTELGHLELRGKDAELRASASVRDVKRLSWKAWAARLDEYLRMVERLFYPDLIILGGGVSKDADRFLPFLTTRSRVVPAALRNEAGIVGAALWAAEVAARAEAPPAPLEEAAPPSLAGRPTRRARPRSRG